MVEIPEDLLRRSAEAKAKALGVPVEDVLAEMKGEGPPVKIPQPEPEPEPVIEPRAEDAETVSSIEEPESLGAGSEPDMTPEPADPEDMQPAESEPATAVATIEAEPPPPAAGNGKVATSVTPRPSTAPAGLPDGVRTQRLLTVVKARAIQDVKAEPQDKVNTWPHLMLMEFGALLLITGLLIIMSVVIHSPLLDPANVNATPNPSKAPWYFLGLQELLSYFDPQIAGVMIPTITGMAGLMMVPFVDRNPSNRPSDRKFAILFYSIFLAGSATLTLFGVLFRGKGFNFSYPWKDGIFFDDLKDWVHFE